MADELLGLLGTSDLDQFNRSVIATDPYGIAGRSLDAWQPNYSTWSPTETGITAFAKSFLSGILGNYARQNAADQVNSVIGVMPQLRSDPMGVVVPEGVNADAFSVLRGNAVAKKAMRDEYLNERDDTRMGSLLQAVLPKLIDSNKITAKDALDISVSDDPASALDSLLAATKATPIASGPSTDSPLANGKESSLQKIQNYYQQFRASGMPDVQAASAAKDQVRGEIAANNKSFDEGKAAREYGQNLMQLANTADSGLANAGQTGLGIASWYEKLVSGLSPILPGSQSEAKQQAMGDTVLDSVAPQVIAMARPVGGGATSDFEAKAYLGSGPSTSNTVEANRVLIDKLRNLGQLNVDYADFIEAYREANSGSTVGAAKKWNEYKQAYPIFKDGEINNERPSWQEYFSAQGSGASALPDVTTFAAQAKARGLTKEQARAEWIAMGGS